MVRRILAALTGLLAACLLVFCACRKSLDFPPRLGTGTVSDTAQVIGVLPDSGAVEICKNGYRVFDLDAIVADDDDPDSTIRWSLSPGPSLDVRLRGNIADIGPAPNQVCASYVVFTATDPGGMSTSRTCLITVFDDAAEFSIDSPAAVEVDTYQNKSVPLTYQYRGDPSAELKWNPPSFDDALLDTCWLDDLTGPTMLTLQALGDRGITGIYFKVRDSVNHVSFSRSIPVTVK